MKETASKAIPKPWLQRLFDKNGPVLLPEDVDNNTVKYQDWLKMGGKEWEAKYMKNVKY
jgi:hypothetical protein